MLYLDKVCMYIHWKTDTKFLYFYSHLPFRAILWTCDSQYAEVLCETDSNQLPRMSWPFHRFKQNYKCSLGLGCIYNHIRGNDLRLLQLITSFMWLRTLTNLSESLVLEVNHNQLSTVQNKTCRIKWSFTFSFLWLLVYVHFLVIGTWFWNCSYITGVHSVVMRDCW
jgi:hypothetical protein